MLATVIMVDVRIHTLSEDFDSFRGQMHRLTERWIAWQTSLWPLTEIMTYSCLLFRTNARIHGGVTRGLFLL